MYTIHMPGNSSLSASNHRSGVFGNVDHSKRLVHTCLFPGLGGPNVISVGEQSVLDLTRNGLDHRAVPNASSVQSAHQIK